MLTEEQEQTLVFQWAKMSEGKFPELSHMYHIPNGGLRSKSEAVRFKRAGTKRGVPDICLPAPRGIYHGLYIEMKREKTGRLSKEQCEWLLYLNEEGYKAVCCYGADEAIKTIIEYLS